MDEDVAVADRRNRIDAFLTSKGLPPTTAWVDEFMQPGRENTPISSLQQTALFRLLSSDLTCSINSSLAAKLPADICKPNIPELRLFGPLTLQLLDVEDIGSSTWSQVEAIEAQERGETTRGREVIRGVPEEPTDSSTLPSVRSNLSLKLLLQDAAGTTAHAFCIRSIEKINLDATIGMKLLLQNVVVARGVILLEPSNVTVLGGRVEAWDTAWRAGRKQRLMQEVTHNATTP